MTEILSNLNLTFALKGKTAKEVTRKLIRVFSIFIINAISKTLTVDNSTEFAYSKLIEEKTNIPVYFARLGTPWEKTTIEHVNKLIREYLPKKSNLNDFPLELFSELAKKYLNKPLISFKEKNIITCKF